MGDPKITVLIPCYNEAASIAFVVRNFRIQLPASRIMVFDNGSTDRSGELAREAGAEVVPVAPRGKGHVVQQIFRTVDSDIYILVDGDGTYRCEDVHRLLDPVMQGKADMAVGLRKPLSRAAMRTINRIGNSFFSALISFFFHQRLRDVLSGYRVFTRAVVDNIALLTYRFEIETEITVKVARQGMKILEVPIDYDPRPGSSSSKLHPLRDGYAIFWTVFGLMRDFKPLTFFGIIAIATWLLAMSYGLFIYFTCGAGSFRDTIILTSMTILGWLFVLIGFTIHTINNRFSDFMATFERRRDRSRDLNP
jgi:glycosyltransferase involved in cell wall biosynthesis